MRESGPFLPRLRESDRAEESTSRHVLRWFTSKPRKQVAKQLLSSARSGDACSLMFRCRHYFSAPAYPWRKESITRSVPELVLGKSRSNRIFPNTDSGRFQTSQSAGIMGSERTTSLGPPGILRAHSPLIRQRNRRRSLEAWSRT